MKRQFETKMDAQSIREGSVQSTYEAVPNENQFQTANVYSASATGNLPNQRGTPEDQKMKKLDVDRRYALTQKLMAYYMKHLKVRTNISSDEVKLKAYELAKKIYVVLKTNYASIAQTTDREILSALWRIIDILENNIAAPDKIYLIPSQRGNLEVVLHYSAMIALYKSKTNLSHYTIEHFVDERGNTRYVQVNLYPKHDSHEQATPFTYTLSIEEASGSGSKSKVWEKQPKLMLCIKALRQALSLYYPEVLAQMPLNFDDVTYDPDYFKGEVNTGSEKPYQAFASPAKKTVNLQPPVPENKADDTLHKIRNLYNNLRSMGYSENELTSFMNTIKEAVGVDSTTKLRDIQDEGKLQKILQLMNDPEAQANHLRPQDNVA